MKPPSCWILVFVWAWSLQQMLVPAEEQRQGRLSCPASSRCGNVTISYPFWLTDSQTGRSCGPLDFEVDCSDNGTTPLLWSSGLDGFEILAIAYEERSLRVLDLAKLKLLKDDGSCHVPRWNTSNMLGRAFRINPVNLNLVFYNCTTASHNPALVQMRCENRSSVFVRVGGYYEGYSVEGCDATVVPVQGSSSSGESNASDYVQLISDGFLVTWEDPSSLEVRGKLFIHQN